MKNIKELRSELSGIFAGLKNGTLDVKVASEMNNSAGKIINTVRAELEYSALSGEKRKIDFLES